MNKLSIKNKDEKNEMLLYSKPHLLSAKAASYPLGCRGIVILSIKVIVSQS